ncbi:glycerophosphodiester phosphodiesterase [Scopulibacillus darangshiensis]
MLKKSGLVIAALMLSVVMLDKQTLAKTSRSLLNPHHILDIAHRGASGYAPEHTLASYKMGERLKGDYVEIDLQMTGDGKLIAMHDETLDRTTNGTGLVKDYTLDEIKQLDAGSWFNENYPEKANPAYVGLKIPTLEDIIDTFGRSANYYIETKSPDVYPGMEEKLLGILKNHKLIGPNAHSGKVIIQSFSKDSLLKIHNMDKSIPLVQLLSYHSDADISQGEIAAIKQYAVGVGPNYKYIDRDYVQKVRNNGLLIHPYTVNTREDMEMLLDWGVTGMFTNYPDLLHEIIKGQPLKVGLGS